MFLGITRTQRESKWGRVIGVAIIGAICVGVIAGQGATTDEVARGNKAIMLGAIIGAWIGMLSYARNLQGGIVVVLITLFCGSSLFKDSAGEMKQLTKEYLGTASAGTGKDSYHAARSWVLHKGDPFYEGNTERARDMAKKYASRVRALRRVAVRGMARELSDYRSYCFETDRTVAFVVAIPRLRKFSREAKRAMEQAAWLAAVETCQKFDSWPERLAVVVRGDLASLNDRIGAFDPEIPDGKAAKKDLYAFFTSDGGGQQLATTRPVAGVGASAARVAYAAVPSLAKAARESLRAERSVLPTSIRMWTSVDGRPLEARLTGFTESSPPEATFERKDGKAFTIATDRFDPASRKAIEAFLPEDGLRDYRDYAGCMEAEFRGRAFVFRYNERLIACSWSRPGAQKPAEMWIEHLDSRPILLDKTKRLSGGLIHLMPLQNQQERVGYLDFSPGFEIKSGEQLWVGIGGNGVYGTLTHAGLPGGTLVPRKGGGGYSIALERETDLRGARCSPVVQVSTGKVVGALTYCDNAMAAKEVVLHPIVLPKGG